MERPVPILRESGDVSHEWIEQVLRRPVRSITRSGSQDSTWGSHTRLQVSLEDGAVPIGLHLKIASAVTFGRAEVDYYTRTFAGLADAPLVRCHHASADATHYNLLLDDHSQTHCDQKIVEPTLAYGLALVEAAAKLHAHHWPQAPPDVSAAERAACKVSDGHLALLEAMNESFTESERATARRLVEQNPSIRRARLADCSGFTWVHGDLNPTNVLAPIRGDGPIYLIDHQPFAGSEDLSWLGIRDLAYAVVVWWPIELRRSWEGILVERWHAVLMSRGVVGYSIAKAWDDWRLCGIQEIDVPAGWCSNTDTISRMRNLWENQLRRILAFAEDHS